MAESKKNWKQQTITIPAQTPFDVSFSGGTDSLPNYFMINNLSPANIYFGIKVLPSPTTYEMKVGANGQNITTRDTPAQRIALYNDSSNPVNIILTTFTDTFDPAVLGSGGSVTVTGGGSGGTSYDGIIKGFTVALPSGNNHLGTVDIGTMPAQTFTLATLPAGSNNIGKVDINSIPSLPVGNNNIGNVGIVGSVAIASMPPVTVSSSPVATQHQSYEASIGTTETVWTLSAPVNQILYITNDDPTNDLFVAFDSITAVTSVAGGTNSVFRLKAGETLNNLGRVTNKIHLIRSAGSGNARFVGV